MNNDIFYSEKGRICCSFTIDSLKIGLLALQAFHSHPVLNFEYPEFAGGAGIGFTAIRKETTELKIEYAVGKNSNDICFTWEKHVRISTKIKHTCTT